MRVFLLQAQKFAARTIATIAPYTHFIPAPVRRKIKNLLKKIARQQPLSVPKPFRPGRYPKGVNLWGFFKAEIGLAQGTKLYAKAIEATGLPHCFLNTSFLHWLPQEDTTFDSKLSNQADYAINVIHINPDQWIDACMCYPKSSMDYRYTIGVWLWELETIPREWLSTLAYVDELWAPSEFIASALRKETDKPVTVIPYGISVPYDSSLTRADFQLPDDRFLVLMMYDSNSYSSRKNPGAAMEAFHQAFQDKKDETMLVIKVNNPKDEDLAFIREKMGDSKYMLITDRMEKTRLNTLISLCNVFISLHRSEGFGLVMAESMALKRPVVATNWSSNTEFMDEESACMVDYQLIPVNNNYQYGQQEHRWADANVAQAAEYLRRLLDDPAYYQQKAEAGYKKITTEFSVECTAAKMKRRIHDILNE